MAGVLTVAMGGTVATGLPLSALCPTWFSGLLANSAGSLPASHGTDVAVHGVVLTGTTVDPAVSGNSTLLCLGLGASCHKVVSKMMMDFVIIQQLQIE